MKIQEINAKLQEVSAKLAKLAESDLDSDEASQGAFDQLSAEFDSLTEKKKRIEAVNAKIAELNVTKIGDDASTEPSSDAKAKNLSDNIPVSVKSAKSKIFAKAEDAYTAGMYFAALGGSEKAKEFMAAQTVGTDSEGGFTVPAPLASELINLLDEYGVARNKCRRIVMGSETWSVPKQTAGATVYYPNEAAAITESALTFSQITLTAQKMAALVKMSREVTESSVISMVDAVVKDIAWAMAKAEDDNLFTGGTILAGGIEGNASVADQNVASVAALALTDLTACTVAAGSERGLRNEWYINPTLYHGKIRDLVNAAGGNTIADLEGGQRPMLLGYPVNLVNAIPGASGATTDLLAVFGDLSAACYFGEIRKLGFQVLNELYAANDQIGVVATQRIDLAVANPEVLSKITVT